MKKSYGTIILSSVAYSIRMYYAVTTSDTMQVVRATINNRQQLTHKQGSAAQLLWPRNPERAK